MLRRMDEEGRPLTDKDIEWAESQLGFRLPRDYRDFLLSHNGGRPEPELFPIHGLAKNPVGALQVFFGIDSEIESSDLLWNVEVMAGRLPANCLPIACDNSGDLICLSLYGPDAGSVLFWDYYGEQPGPIRGYENVYKIAESFGEFLNALHG